MWLDLRFVFRMLLKQPGYTIIAVLAIALGISTATSHFTFYNALMLRPMPFVTEESRVVVIRAYKESNPSLDFGLPMASFLDLRDRVKTLEGFTIWQPRTYILGGTEPVERVSGVWMSAECFPMLGVQPIMGRNFRVEEAEEDAAKVAILSHNRWQRSYGGNKDIVGQPITVNGESTTVIGIMPEGFFFPSRHEVWMPFKYNSEKKADRADFRWQVLARIRPGLSLAEVAAELNVFAGQLAREHPTEHRGIGIHVFPMREEWMREQREHMNLIFAACVSVLLIACGNVANLMLAKGAARSREIAVRLALGAGRRRIISLVLIESLLLAVAGGILGVLIAAWRNDLIVAMLPDGLIPFWWRFDMDWIVVLYSLVLSLVVAVLAGILPSIHTSRSDLGIELKDGGTRGSTASKDSVRIRSVLVVVQIAIALILLVGAGLFYRSLLKLQNSDPGVRPEGVLTFRVGLPPTQFKEESVVREFWVKLRQRLRELPGVEASGVVEHLPSSSVNDFLAIYVEGRALPKVLAEAPGAYKRPASTGALEALGVPLIRGRMFNDGDTPETTQVCLIDQAFAEAFFPNEDPIGRRIADGPLDTSRRKWREIVGIVGNARQVVKPLLPERSFWTNQAQESGSFAWGVVRVKSGDPMLLAKAVQDAVFSAMPDIPIYTVRPLTEVVRESFWDSRFFSRLFLSFSGTALFLAAIGIYGVMSYSVAQRTQEIGVRMALGAQPRDVVRLVLRQGLLLIAAGLAAGFVCSWMVAHLLEAHLYQIRAHDPPTFALVPLMLAGVALLACWLPSRRATRIAPIMALRAD